MYLKKFCLHQNNIELKKIKGSRLKNVKIVKIAIITKNVMKQKSKR